MRTLHVAALPYPTAQGTQALIHAMLDALGAAGHESHLLCYGHGDALSGARYHLHRARRGRGRRSGPSLEKLWLDADLARHLHKLVCALRPDAVIAHHVEAALCAAVVGMKPWFVAHTSLESELPTYYPAFAAPLAAFGRRLDTQLVRSAVGTFAVSPLLATMLQEQSGRGVTVAPIPWRVPEAITPEERRAARAELGLSAQHEVALYAGNLDGYQGLPPMLSGLRRALRERAEARVLIATEAPARRAHHLLRSAGLDSVATVVRLKGEATRRLVHAAADRALVPRLAPGGVPIKLLDALARGVPVLAAERALAGFALRPLCDVIDGDDSHAWYRALATAFCAPLLARERAEKARVELSHVFAPETFVTTFERALLGSRR